MGAPSASNSPSALSAQAHGLDNDRLRASWKTGHHVYILRQVAWKKIISKQRGEIRTKQLVCCGRGSWWKKVLWHYWPLDQPTSRHSQEYHLLGQRNRQPMANQLIGQTNRARGTAKPINLFLRRQGTTSLHNVYFVKYDVTVSFLAQVLNTVTYFVPQVLDTAT